MLPRSSKDPQAFSPGFFLFFFSIQKNLFLHPTESADPLPDFSSLHIFFPFFRPDFFFFFPRFFSPPHKSSHAPYSLLSQYVTISTTTSMHAWLLQKPAPTFEWKTQLFPGCQKKRWFKRGLQILLPCSCFYHVCIILMFVLPLTLYKSILANEIK